MSRIFLDASFGNIEQEDTSSGQPGSEIAKNTVRATMAPS